MPDVTDSRVPDYTPDDWYWRKADGSLYSSRRMAIVNDGDADYREWLEAVVGRQPSAYPRDADGDESLAALARALAPTTAFASLTDYARDRRWAKEVGGITLGGMAVATDDRSKTLIMGARIEADQNAEFETPYDAPDGTEVVLNAQQIIAISDAVLAHTRACFSLFSAVRGEIEAGTVTTPEQVRELFA